MVSTTLAVLLRIPRCRLTCSTRSSLQHSFQPTKKAPRNHRGAVLYISGSIGDEIVQSEHVNSTPLMLLADFAGCQAISTGSLLGIGEGRRFYCLRIAASSGLPSLFADYL